MAWVQYGGVTATGHQIDDVVAQEVGEFSRIAVLDDVSEDAGDLSCLSLGHIVSLSGRS